MKLPNSCQAEIEDRKLREYLLSLEHPVGRFKAGFFSQLGYCTGNWLALREKLLKIAREGVAVLGEKSKYGQKYLVFGNLDGPEGRSEVITVWIVLKEDDKPRLVTVYPR